MKIGPKDTERPRKRGPVEELSDKNEKLKKQGGGFFNSLSEKEKDLQKRLQGPSEHWEANALEWNIRQRELEEEGEEEELQV